MSTPNNIPKIAIHPPTPTPSEPHPPTTTYHLYHAGNREKNIVLYTIPNRDLPPSPHIDLPTSPHRFWCRKSQQVDPRSPSYYLHTPNIVGHSPPQTLRLGGKTGGVVCLLDRALLWRRWRLDFVVPEKEGCWWSKRKKEEEKECRSDERKSLNAPNTIDPRGVVASHYPLRSFGLLTETGREYIRQSRQNPELSGAVANPVEIPEHLVPSTPSLEMTWLGWTTREYAFEYGGIEFRWKGTGTVRDERKHWGMWSRYNHLKLVAYLPCDKEYWETGEAQHPVVLAKYISIWAKQKVGRLLVFENGLAECFGSDEVERERLRHIIVATALCMIQGEKEKREAICEIVGGAAQGAGG